MGIAHKVHEAQEEGADNQINAWYPGDSAGRAAHPDLRGGGHGDPGAERGQLYRDPPHCGLSSSGDMVVTVDCEAPY